MEHIVGTGPAHSWFVLTQKIIEKEFALSGSEQDPDLTGKDLALLAKRVAPGAPGPVEAFTAKGADFVVADTLHELLAGMQSRSPEVRLDFARTEREIRARDRELDNDFTKDAQITAIRRARIFRGGRLIRVATPHKLRDPRNGPLIAVKLHILTRKSLGGIETDLVARGDRPRRPTRPRPVRGRGGQRFRRRRHERLPLARGHVPRRLPVLRSHRGPRRHTLVARLE
nr:FAD-binding protein [Cryobacterium algoritolerans]